MIFSAAGFPRVANATDWADSPVLAAWLRILDHPQAISMSRYRLENNPLPAQDRLLIRHPRRSDFPRDWGTDQMLRCLRLESDPRCFSGDQTIMWTAGRFFEASNELRGGYRIRGDDYLPRYFAQNNMDEVSGKWKMPDFFQKAAREHLRLCAGLLWSPKALRKTLEFNGTFTPMREQNQTQVMALCAGRDAVRYYIEKNPRWEYATFAYWCDESVVWNEHIKDLSPSYNRGEPDLALSIVEFVKGVAQGRIALPTK